MAARGTGPSGCDTEILGIPESIPRARVVELVQALGLELRDLRRFSVKVHAIEAEVFARDEHGHRYSDDGEHIAVHHIVVPIVDELATREVEVTAQPTADDVGQAVVDVVTAYERWRGADPGAGPQTG